MMNVLTVVSQRIRRAVRVVRNFVVSHQSTLALRARTAGRFLAFRRAGRGGARDSRSSTHEGASCRVGPRILSAFLVA